MPAEGEEMETVDRTAVTGTGGLFEVGPLWEGLCNQRLYICRGCAYAHMHTSLYIGIWFSLYLQALYIYIHV